MYLPPDPAGRTSYVAGEIAPHDFWSRYRVAGRVRAASHRDPATGAHHGVQLFPLVVRGAGRVGAVPRVPVRRRDLLPPQSVGLGMIQPRTPVTCPRGGSERGQARGMSSNPVCWTRPSALIELSRRQMHGGGRRQTHCGVEEPWLPPAATHRRLSGSDAERADARRGDGDAHQRFDWPGPRAAQSGRGRSLRLHQSGANSGWTGAAAEHGGRPVGR